MRRAALLLWVTACTQDGPIVYATVDGLDLTLDVWQPAEQGPHPGVMLIHGGGWKHGDLYDGGLDEQAQTAAEAGFVAVSVNYRLSTEAVWPAQRDDVGCALRWMRLHADDYDIDPSRVAVVGHSAGGHLSLILAEAPESTPPDWCAAAAEDGVVQAVVSVAGPADLPLTWALSTDWGQRMVNELLGLPRDATPETDPASYASASPLAFVDETGPPVLQVAGTDDKLVPSAQAESFDAALAGRGREHELLIRTGYDHNELNEVEAWLPYLEATLQP